MPVPPLPVEAAAVSEATVDEAEAFTREDDDSVNVPAPSAEYLAHTHRVGYASARIAPPKYQNLEYKRTIIPVLLTMGICLAAIATSKFVFAEDTKLGNLPTWVPIALYVFAAAAVAFALLTMVQVKSTLAQQQSGRPAEPVLAT